jgi:ABC-type branched-subunit amino acid transport system substrate-binding protein
VRAAGLALAALLPALALAQLPQPVRVGFVCPFSGGSQDFGNAARLGAELAVKEINEAGGFLGRPLQLVARDDKANPDEGRKIAEEFVLQKKADFTVGYCNSGVAAKALDVYHDHQHLLMIPVATGTALTARYAPSASFVFRLSVRDSLQATAIVDEIVRRGLTRVAIFADNTGYGEGGLKDVKQRLEEKKLTPVHVARFDLGVSTLTAAMQEAKAAGANAIVSYTVGPEQAVVLQSRAEARLAAPLFGPWTLAFRSVIERAGASVVEGAVMPADHHPGPGTRTPYLVPGTLPQAGRRPRAHRIADGRHADLRRRAPDAACAVPDPRRRPWPGAEGRAGKPAARLQRRRHHLRQALRPHRPRRHHAQHDLAGHLARRRGALPERRRRTARGHHPAQGAVAAAITLVGAIDVPQPRHGR